MCFIYHDSNIIMVNLKHGECMRNLFFSWCHRQFKRKTVLLNRFRLPMSEGEFYFPSWCLDFGAATSADESHIPAEPRKT